MAAVEELPNEIRPVLAGLAEAYGPGVRIEGLHRDGGGASRLTNVFEAVTAAGERHRLVLRRATPGASEASSPLAREAALMRAAREVGAPVPEVVAVGDGAGADEALEALEYIVMTFIEGETIPRRILRAPELAEVREGLAAECGRILAAIHRIPPKAVPDLPGEDQLEAWAQILDGLGTPYPALELALRRLSLNRPDETRRVVVHGDFRNGNLMIGPDGVRAVLDWELSHLGDPLEDLGWLCAKAWRFGAPRPVGGFGEYEQLVGAYEEASGTAVDRDAVRWWELFGTFRWGVICAMQTHRHLTGGERSVELAALGRRVAENEWDLLQALA
ncbi:phosphotransferase family protein [Actinocorallia aurantiaca]|uniref:Phosphotransferase family protein n=1 Tax=Actinocorallia aurantiaca TaxID=46204 RepID=A0ABN3U1X4_9ACTN